jgi:hypothetical protein
MPYEAMDDIRQKVAWAERHINSVKASIQDFMATRPYEIRIETDTESGEPEVHVLKAAPIPPAVRLGCGDAIQTLRSALDYLACALVRANGSTVNKHVEFPILDHPIRNSEDRKIFGKKVAGMRQEASDQILKMKPCQGGDNVLWRLHRLNIIDKHRMLMTAFGNITAVNSLPPIAEQWDGNRWRGIPGVPFGIKEGDKFTPKTPGLAVGKDSGFFAELVFNEVDIAEGYPIVWALSRFNHRVKEICGQLSWALN